MLDGLDAVTLGLLNSPEGKSGKEGGGSEDKETTKETTNTEGEGARKEGGNSNGPTGSSPTGSNTTTVIVSVPAQSPTATSADSSKTAGEIKINTSGECRAESESLLTANEEASQPPLLSR